MVGAACLTAALTPARALHAQKDVVRTLMPAVVTIEAGPATGSGFFVAPDTVRTNRHVIGGASDFGRVRFSNGATSPAYVSSTAVDADLALVRVEQPPAAHPTLALRPTRRSTPATAAARW